MKRNSAFQYFSSVRFAIPALLLFAGAMIFGTLQESLHGAEYARRAVYQSWWFYLAQGLIAASVFLAMLSRLPFKPRLFGFYLVHIALLTIMAGSVVTKLYGIDGSIEVNSQEKRSTLRVDRDRLYLRQGEQVESFPLPDSARAENLNRLEKLGSGATLRLLRYIPFAEETSLWRPRLGGWASVWQLRNDRLIQKFQIGNEMAGALERSQELGPLHVEVVDQALSNAIGSGNHQDFLLIDSVDGKSYSIPNLNHEFHFQSGKEKGTLSQATNQRVNITFIKMRWGHQTFVFLPHFSPYPVTDQMQSNPDARFKLFQLKGRGNQSSVFLSPLPGHGVRMVYGKGEAWQEKTLLDTGEEIELPWMGFKMRLLEEHRDQLRVSSYEPRIPQREEEPSLKALRLEIESGNHLERYWVTNRGETDSHGALFYLGATEAALPFSLQLEHFKMEMVPGTESPATYESFVKVKDLESQATNEAHIYMNHPFKAAGYTFYQSSYLEDGKGEFHSILSVNRDPGRSLKYLGALLLLAGLVLHYLILHGKLRLA